MEDKYTQSARLKSVVESDKAKKSPKPQALLNRPNFGQYLAEWKMWCKYTKNLRKNGRMRVKFDKWLVHIPFLCYLTILLNLAEGAEYGGC